VSTTATMTDTAVHPFRVDVPGEEIADLQRRIIATRWPSQELVADRSQGVQLATIQELARYWATDYDWRKCEAKLNALPQFTTQIDGVGIHFIHVKSPHQNAMPLIITHGWPGSVIELLEVVGPLTDPPAHGRLATQQAVGLKPIHDGGGRLNGKAGHSRDFDLGEPAETSRQRKDQPFVVEAHPGLIGAAGDRRGRSYGLDRFRHARPRSSVPGDASRRAGGPARGEAISLCGTMRPPKQQVNNNSGRLNYPLTFTVIFVPIETRRRGLGF